MDVCGALVDNCHEECNNCCPGNDVCHANCYYQMCRCFKQCGCPECCETINEINDIPDYSGEIEEFLESDKTSVSQFLKKQTNYQ